MADVSGKAPLVRRRTAAKSASDVAGKVLDVQSTSASNAARKRLVKKGAAWGRDLIDRLSRNTLVRREADEHHAVEHAHVTHSIGTFSHGSPMYRIEAMRKGVSPTFLEQVTLRMKLSQIRAMEFLALPRETIRRKAKKGDLLKPDESERVIGLARIIGEVDRVVRESGTPEGFDAAEWTGRWLEQPNTALGGRKPADLLDTVEGQTLVIDLIGRAQSGAYA